MNNHPKISVIVAAFNGEKYIGRCLRSLLNQTLPHSQYEIIVIDDGSEDLTSYALELFCDRFESPVHVIRNEKNLGLPASVNRGIRAARADYIVRVDSDDFVNSNFLNLLYLYLDTNPEADAVACDYYWVDSNENIIERANCLKNPIACGILFHKENLFDIGLYDEEFRFHEEREMRSRFEKKYEIRRLDIPLYRYRRHDNNMTNNSKNMDKYERLLQEKIDKGNRQNEL